MLLKMEKFHSLWQSIIPLNIYCVFFSHSSANGQLGWFHIFLAFVNNAAMILGVHVFFQVVFLVLWDPYFQVESLSPFGSSIFTFLRNSTLFSKLAVPIYIPTSHVNYGSFFSTSSPTNNFCLCSFC